LSRELARFGGNARLLDVGSGAGLPGVVFAIACPQLQVTCVDTVGKKAAFIGQVAAALGVNNLRGVHARVETLSGPFELISSRAFATLADFTAGSRQALAPGGLWLAMKGKSPDAELAELAPSLDVFHVEPLAVPGLEAQRCIVWMRERVASPTA
jgi:16S rRNA (guanine527-N7)-methyltransferase